MLDLIGEASTLIEFYLRPLTPFLDDPAVEDVAIQQPGECWVYHAGAWLRHQVEQLSYEDLESLTIVIGGLRRQEVNDEFPICDEKLPSGARFCGVLPPAVPAATAAITIRKHSDEGSPFNRVSSRYDSTGWNTWREERSSRKLDRSLAAYDSGDFLEFLRAAVTDRLNIVFVGPTGSGKTTLSKSVIDAIAKDERVITIEDTAELSSLPPNNVRLLYSKGGTSTTAIGHEQLLQTAMRMRPRRIIVGEMRDDAVLTWVLEACTGHPGGLTTIHGSNAREAIRRISQLIKSSPRGAQFDPVELLGDTIDVIIPLYEMDNRAGRGIGAVWFAGDAQRRGQTIADFL